MLPTGRPSAPRFTLQLRWPFLYSIASFSCSVDTWYSLESGVRVFLVSCIVHFFASEEAVPYFESLSTESSSEALNEAEWLTDVVVKADRNKRALEFSETFHRSSLKQVCSVLQGWSLIQTELLRFWTMTWFHSRKRNSLFLRKRWMNYVSNTKQSCLSCRRYGSSGGSVLCVVLAPLIYSRVLCSIVQ